LNKVVTFRILRLLQYEAIGFASFARWTEYSLRDVTIGQQHMHIQDSRRTRAAFSLIEIIIALGILSFALVGILGLIPAAIGSSQESQRETQAALIARKIFNDLNTRKPSFRNDGTAPATLVDLTKDGIYTADYTEAGQLPGESPSDDARLGKSPIYNASVKVRANQPLQNVSNVELTIRTPADAAPKNQRTYLFTALLKGTP
jgi:uncharacterized protein (TIGR02598 family)